MNSMGEVVEIVYFPNHDWHRKKPRKKQKRKKNKTNRKNLISNQFTSRCYFASFASLHNSADSKQNHGKSLQS